MDKKFLLYTLIVAIVACIPFVFGIKILYMLFLLSTIVLLCIPLTFTVWIWRG